MAQSPARQPNDNVEYVGRIRSRYASLSKAQKRIANYILNHPDEVIHYSITMMASKTGTVPSTVTRFCQALSYHGFSELKVYIEKNLISPSAVSKLIQPDDTMSIVLQKLSAAAQTILSDSLRTLNEKTVADAAAAILNAGTVNLYGQSGGYISCLYAQQMLLRAGILSHVSNDALDMELAAATLRQGDVAIGIAYSGEIRSVIQALDTARANHARTIIITAAANSTMAKAADYVLSYSHDIPDDLAYLHIGSMCEISIIGALQAELLRHFPAERLGQVKKFILTNRIR